MIRYFLLLLLLKSILFGCSICSVYTPKTDVTTYIESNKTHIKTLTIHWNFATVFSKELLKLYDLNLDGSFNKEELELIEDAMINYLEPRNFITKISYDKQINEESNSFKIKNYKTYYEDSSIHFEYSIDLNYKIYDKNILNINIHDNEGYFFIIFDKKKQLFNIPYEVSKKIDANNVSFTINDSSLPVFQQKEKLELKKEKNLENKKEVQKDENKKIEEVEEVKEDSLLEKFTYNIKKYLVAIEKGEDKYALFFLLTASFIYGVLHALGPGHGKALAFSYFSARKSTYLQAFVISLVTAFIHIIGALILVLFSVFILQSVLNSFLEDSISYVTALCAVIIMLLAAFILYRKLGKKTHACCACNVDLNTTNFSLKPSNMNFVKTNTNKPILDTKRSKKEDLIFVLTAGIVPCPGTVLLFVYAFLLKTYFSVLLASIAISLGMAVVIFASSFLGVSLHKVSEKSGKITDIVEIIAPIFMFILGLLLLLNSGSFNF
ncbi:MAG: sodium:proton antiporter [Arcobacter sp.]|nr:sodium:proton antiporter [Arcobacter sp.]|tara:strand:- start:2281 stop:3762 length:1482 start_codon:yes stop_codon:yes gene_type:complete